MQIDFADITARVYAEAKGIYWVSLQWGDSGMHTSSFTVRESPKHPEKGLWVQPPKSPPRWVSPFEFAGDSPLWELIEKLCRDAVADYTQGQKLPPQVSDPKDRVLTIEDVDRITENYDQNLSQAIEDLDKKPP
jgi:hypothetical protein